MERKNITMQRVLWHIWAANLLWSNLATLLLDVRGCGRNLRNKCWCFAAGRQHKNDRQHSEPRRSIFYDHETPSHRWTDSRKLILLLEARFFWAFPCLQSEDLEKLWGLLRAYRDEVLLVSSATLVVQRFPLEEPWRRHQLCGEGARKRDLYRDSSNTERVTLVDFYHRDWRGSP